MEFPSTIRELICEYLCIRELAELYVSTDTCEFIPPVIWVRRFKHEFSELYDQYNLDFNIMLTYGYSDEIVTMSLMMGYKIHQCLIRDEFNYYLYMRLQHPTLPADYTSHRFAKYVYSHERGYIMECNCDNLE